MSDVLSVRDLVIRIGETPSPLRPVDGISFTIAAGECYSLLGESGCGKSMTALAIARLLPEAARVSGGEVDFLGRELLGLPEATMREVRGGGIGMIFQEPATSLNPVLTVGRQVVESLELHAGLRGKPANERALELLTQVGIPDPQRRLGEYPFQLSGGMRQRVMIAIALAGNPRLLIADEPTTALDVTIQAQVLDLLDSLRRERGMALLLITHDLGVVARMADRIGVMYAGQLVEEASRAQFFSKATHPYSVRLFAALPDSTRRGEPLSMIPGSVPPLEIQHRGCRFADRCSEVMPICRVEIPILTDRGDGHVVRCHLDERVAAGTSSAKVATKPTTGKDRQPLLEVTDLRVHFPIRRGLLQRTVGHVRAVDGVSLKIMPGRTMALVGESGCGKTTVGKAILQLVQPSAGSVRLEDAELTTLTAQDLRPLRAKMQMVFQDPFASLNPRMRVGEILAEGPVALRNEAKGGVRVAELLEKVGLRPDMGRRYPHEFSGGQRQRIAIARALAVKPNLLICDEPTSALDVSVQAQILNLLSELQRDLNLAYLFITHNIAVVEYLADEVAVMYLGRIVERGSVAEVLRTPRHPYTQALLAAVPKLDGERQGPGLHGDMPSSAKPPSGCHFHTRCPFAVAACAESYPAETRFGETHHVRCFFPLNS